MQTIEIRQVALTAHNRNAEFPCFNENYNEANNLGNRTERTRLRRISMDVNGGREALRLTRKNVNSYVFEKDNELFQTIIID